MALIGRKITGLTLIIVALFACSALSLIKLRPIDAQADTEDPRVKLGAWVGPLKVGRGMKAVGKCLRGSEFVGQDLRGAVFDGSDLGGVRFCECDLSDASFRNACLTGMHLDECCIKDADFTNAIVNGILGISLHSAGPREMNLSEQQLVSTRSYKMKDLRKCVIGSYKGYQRNRPPKYDFGNAQLDGAILLGEDFTESDFTDAEINGIELHDCRIAFRQVASTKYFARDGLRRMAFQGVHFVGKVALAGKNLTGTVFLCPLPDADFGGAKITRCTFGSSMTMQYLCSTESFRAGNLSHVTFIRMNFSGCDLSRQNLSGCRFDDCDFPGVSFDNAVLTDAQFEYKTSGLTLDQIKSTWNYKNGRMEGIVLPKDLADALRAER